MTYLERLQQTSESKNIAKAEMNSREAQLQLTKDTLDAEKRNIAAQQKLGLLKGQFPLNSAAILEAMYEAETAQQNFSDLIDLSLELFPANVRKSVNVEEEAAAPKRETKATATKRTTRK